MMHMGVTHSYCYGLLIFITHTLHTTNIRGFLWLGIICADNEEWEGHCKCACTVWRNEDLTP